MDQNEEKTELEKQYFKKKNLKTDLEAEKLKLEIEIMRKKLSE